MSWRAEGKQLLFRVSDTRPGIAAHDLKHIFEPLYRVEDSRSCQTGGTGMAGERASYPRAEAIVWRGERSRALSGSSGCLWR